MSWSADELILWGGILICLAISWRFILLHILPEQHLTILMYHSIMPTSANSLTVTVSNFEAQLKYLRSRSYTSIFFNEINTAKARKKIIITFDDGYRDNLQYAAPVLERLGMKATIFLPTQNTGTDADKLNYDEIRRLPKNIELAMHSHTHLNYAQLSDVQIDRDIEQNKYELVKNGINFIPVLAYPYGKYPKRKSFKEILEKHKIRYAVKIGNRINFLPARKKFTLNRVNIEGADSLQMFKFKLLFGKIPFS